jgi:SulP family sulfate permease
MDTLKADAIAWITWAIIVLPQWIAFATIAWLPPEYWLYTAMVTPIIAAIFWSSWHLVSWPTTAISLVIFSTISWFTQVWTTEFIQLTLVLTFLAWVYQLVFWLVKLWKVVDFVSHTVVIWFTAWAALLIVTSQMKSILWIKIPSWTEFLETWKVIFESVWDFKISTITVWVFTLLVAVLIKKYFKNFPNLLISLVLGSALAVYLKPFSSWLSFVPAIPSKLPDFWIPNLSYDNIKTLASSAFAIAILWLIEAVSISRWVASKSHQIIDSNQEFIWQWMSNIVWSFFSAYAWSWSFTRSWVNYSAWAKTPMSAIFAAIFLMIIILVIAPITHYISISAMAWVIVLVWYNLIDLAKIKHIIKSNKSEVSILAVTFFSTLFLELEFAIYLGIFLSLVLFLNKTSNPKIATMLSVFDKEKNKKVLVWTCKLENKEIDKMRCPQLEIIRIDMSIYFWSTNYIHQALNDLIINKWVKNILILCSSVNFIDMTWMEMLEEVSGMLKKMGWWLYFLEVKMIVMRDLKKSWFIKAIWEEYFFEIKKEAINHIYSKLDKDVCKGCKNKVFTECTI